MVQPRDADSPHWKYLQPADLRRLRNFQFAARLVVEGFFQGQHRSPHYDFSSEFADYRPYTPGDEIRAIDWRAFARTDRFYIKLYRKETDMNCYLLVDKSNSMGYRGDAPLTKLEYASYLAASLADLMVQQGDKASLALGDDALRSLFGTIKRKGLLVVLSDFLDDTAPAFSALSMFAHKGFAILLFHIMTDAE